ncbi:Alpha-2,8-sialyltransferase 8E [Branchiostoma belcheri]|nr:Alpha-2,8-sialyltransferase 8E [Branchiostoma belcheri]
MATFMTTTLDAKVVIGPDKPLGLNSPVAEGLVEATPKSPFARRSKLPLRETSPRGIWLALKLARRAKGLLAAEGKGRNTPTGRSVELDGGKLLEPRRQPAPTTIATVNLAPFSDFTKPLRDLLEISHFHEYFTATKKNSPLNSLMYFFEKNKKVRIPVSGPVWFRLPKELPFSKDDRFNTCAVVGNSGILKNSKCSNRIDSSDLVIRCNFAPVDGNYTEDVGRKTGLMTLNPSILIHTYKWLLMRRDQDRFLRDMGHYGNALVYTNPFHFREVTDIVIKTRPTEVVLLPPYIPGGVTEFWRRRNVTERRLSTGLFLTSAALALCSQVQLYGFWPFSTDRQGNTLPYHYYDKSSINSMVHNISEEFGHLLQLYREGIVNITTHPCESNPNSSRSSA